jgi:hypothetical protein
MSAIVSSRVVWFLLLVSPAALSQQAVKRTTVLPLPDAPSTLSPSAGIFRAFNEAVRSPATTQLGAPGNPAQLPYLQFHADPLQSDSGKFFEKYLSPAAVKRSHIYHPLTEGKLMSRATYAASSILILRDPAGKKKLNTSYLLSVLAATASHAAGSSYRRRSASQPFGDVGSTIGNDAGMNVFHEFEPGIRALVQSHTPRFVSRIENHILK